MAQIISDKNNGSRNGTLMGLVQVGWNVCPDEVTAAPTAATLTQAQINKWNYFTIGNTSGATDEFDLPALANVGQSFAFFCEDTCEIRTTTETDTINAVASKGFTPLAGDLVLAVKVTATGWFLHKILASDGAVTSIVPGVAA